jgi:hypothetical protein
MSEIEKIAENTFRIVFESVAQREYLIPEFRKKLEHTVVYIVTNEYIDITFSENGLDTRADIKIILNNYEDYAKTQEKKAQQADKRKRTKLVKQAKAQDINKDRVIVEVGKYQEGDTLNGFVITGLGSNFEKNGILVQYAYFN